MNKIKLSTIITEFLAENNLSELPIKPIKNDASKRSYFRFNNHTKNLLLMDASLEKKTISNFILLSKWLSQNHFSAPSIYCIDKVRGLLLLEDFGISKFSLILKKNKSKKLYYYKKAIETLIYLSEKKPPNFLQPYDNKVLLKELRLFLTWHLGYKIENNNREIREWNIIWKSLIQKIDKNSSCMVLRDYHIDNIFYLPKRKKIKDIGLIDYQDALIGHPSYDLVSLLQDVRTFVSKKEQKVLYDYYIRHNNLNLEGFRQTYLILGTQRLIKIIGIFKRLDINENNKNYLRYLPRTWKLLFENLKDPIFYELKNWINQYC